MIISYYDNKVAPILSICIVTYNQREYICKAIDSVLSQKTKYPFEVLIGDDCSTDGTREILEEYKKNHPEIYFYLSEVNTYHTENHLFKRLENMSRGKYLNYLEGDDYWISNDKIQLQLSFLEKNPEYLAVASKCVVVDKNSRTTDISYPECIEKKYSKQYWFNGIMPGQTASFMFVNRKYHPEIDWSLLDKGLTPGDRLRYYLLILHGEIGCLEEVLTAYRFVKDEGGSFSANYMFSYSKFNSWYEAVVEYTYKHGNKKDILLSEVMYFVFCMRCLKRGQVKVKDVIFPKYRKSGLVKIYFTFIKQQISRVVFRKKNYVS